MDKHDTWGKRCSRLTVGDHSRSVAVGLRYTKVYCRCDSSKLQATSDSDDDGGGG